MNGYGSIPFGSGPYGVGTPIAGPDHGGSLFFVTMPGPDAGKSTGSRRINHRTGDYVVGTNGRLEGMGDSAQLVQIAIASLKLAGGRITPATQGIIRRQIDDALAHLVGPGRIVVRELVFDRFKAEGILSSVRWEDLSTQQEGEVSVG